MNHHAEDTQHLIGTVIGNYRLIELIGRGSMSDVYLAKRADDIHDEVVALKTTRAWGDPNELHARMKRERKILSQFTHPNIATFIDGGSVEASRVETSSGETKNTENQRPYFVLEYIKGQNIISWSQQQDLDINVRLRLFLKVCSAVYAAHSKLILHRDIKPSNILINPQGEPKLLDFGIAKILDDSDNELLTRFESPMTPQYASPEQLKHHPLSVASDQYSLGVVLYELLTDNLPYRVDDKRSFNINADHKIPLPSAVVVDKTRAKRLKGDLDAIVIKTLNKDPDLRYSSVKELASDIQCFLENKTVRAQPPSVFYSTAQFFKRNRARVIMASGLLCVLLGVAVTQQIRIVNERNDAVSERDKYEQTQDFLFELFENTNPENLPTEDITARQLLHQGTELIEHKFSGQPQIKSAMLLAIGKAYYKLRLNDLAFKILSESLAIQNASGGRTDETRAITLSHLASLSIGEGKPEQAKQYIEESLRIFSQLENKNQHEWVLAHFLAGEVDYGLRNIEESTQHYLTALELNSKAFGEDDPFSTGIYANLSENYGYVFDFDQALVYNNLALEQARKTPRESEFHLPKIYNVQGVIYWWKDNLPQALNSFHLAINKHLELYGEHTPSVVEDYMNAATIYNKLGEFEKSLEYFNKALDVLNFHNNKPILAKTYTSMGRPLISMNRIDDALENALKGLMIKEEIYADRSSEPFALSFHLLGTIHEAKGNIENAIDYYTRANAIRVKLYGDDNKWTKENAEAMLRLNAKQTAPE